MLYHLSECLSKSQLVSNILRILGVVYVYLMQFLTLVKMQFVGYTTSVNTMRAGLMHAIAPIPGQGLVVMVRL